MNWLIDKARPICPQIVETISALIATGRLKPDEKLSSVRDVAVEAGINPNTVQKAFSELERSGLIYSRPGSGWYVSENPQGAEASVEQLAIEKTGQYIREMTALGKSEEEILGYISKVSEDRRHCRTDGSATGPQNSEQSVFAGDRPDIVVITGGEK